MPVEGLEPPLTCVKQILSLSRLPFRHTGGESAIMREDSGGTRKSRLAYGFASVLATIGFRSLSHSATMSGVPSGSIFSSA